MVNCAIKLECDELVKSGGAMYFSRMQDCDKLVHCSRMWMNDGVRQCGRE